MRAASPIHVRGDLTEAMRAAAEQRLFDFARSAKISRISCVRSRIFRSKTFSRLRPCAGLN